MNDDNQWKELQSVEEEEEEDKTIMTVDRNDGSDGYEKVTITVDSGAADTVGPKAVADKLPIRPTRSSRLGINYKAANGPTTKNYGERRLEGWNERGIKTGITMQVADVNKV